MQQNGAALSDPEGGPHSIALWNDIVLPTAASLELYFDVSLPSGPDLEATVTPDFLFAAIDGKSLTDLDGTELTAGDQLASTGTMTVVRYDLPPGADGVPLMEPTPATFWFSVVSYAAPVVPDGPTTDFITPSFLSLAFISTATSAFGTLALQGTVSYTLQKTTTTMCPGSNLLETD
jgi:hypothetical protein